MGREVEVLLLVCNGHCRFRSVVLNSDLNLRNTKADRFLIVSVSGIVTDLLVYSIVIPVMPFHLESLGYTNVASLTGWLLFAYVGMCDPRLLAMILTFSFPSAPVWGLGGLYAHSQSSLLRRHIIDL